MNRRDFLEQEKKDLEEKISDKGKVDILKLFNTFNIVGPPKI